jgi:hypothetical protein
MVRIKVEVKFFGVPKDFFKKMEEVLKVKESGNTRWIEIFSKEGVEITFFEE